MKNLEDGRQKLQDLIGLLRVRAGFDLTGHIHGPRSNGASRPELIVELEGSDVPLLTTRNGELLHAIEHLAAKILDLEPAEHDRISVDAGKFKAKRDAEIQALAAAAIAEVRSTSAPFVFAPMMSRERRLLHLALASSGLKTASTGERFRRSVVLYPEGVEPPTDPPSK